MEYQYHEDGTLPSDMDSIFVFGSNLDGRELTGAEHRKAISNKYLLKLKD